MAFNLSSPASRSGQSVPDQVSLSAAYADSAAARAAVEDLERAGLRPTVIVPMGPWPVPPPPGPGVSLFEHPFKTALTGALILAALTALGSLLWLDGRHWLLYAGLGALVGALSGWIGSAMAATAHPPLEEDLLAYPGGGLTVEVEADEPGTARLAETVMGGHEPTLFKAWARPGRRPPAERVMWEHEAGLSPLQAVGSWLEETEADSPVAAKGKHLQAGRVRP